MSSPEECPSCKANLVGGSIWQTFRDQYGSDEKADEVAAMYGATRTKGNWGRAIACYDLKKDRTTGWLCPDCDHRWGRS